MGVSIAVMQASTTGRNQNIGQFLEQLGEQFNITESTDGQLEATQSDHHSPHSSSHSCVLQGSSTACSTVCRRTSASLTCSRYFSATHSRCRCGAAIYCFSFLTSIGYFCCCCSCCSDRCSVSYARTSWPSRRRRLARTSSAACRGSSLNGRQSSNRQPYAFKLFACFS